jgi:hypothetical protein
MGFVGVVLALAVSVAAIFVRRLGRVGALLAAAASVAVVALLVANVFGEDDYADTGQSRWERRTGGAAHALFVIEAVVGGLVAAGFVLIAFRRDRATRIGPLLTALAVAQAIGAWIVLVAFNAN